MSGCGAVWLARYLGVVEVAGSSPVTPTIDTPFFMVFLHFLVFLFGDQNVTILLENIYFCIYFQINIIADM